MTERSACRGQLVVTVGQTPRHPLLCAMAPPSAETSRIVLSLVLDRITKRDDFAAAIAILYQTCKTWRKQLSDDGFCMRTFSLCRALADGNSPQTLQRVQATIGRQLEQTSDKDETDQAWWLDARSLVQRQAPPPHKPTLVGSGTVWSWLQAASQEPDAGPLSWRAAATARSLRQPLVSWPGKPQVRHPGQ